MAQVRRAGLVYWRTCAIDEGYVKIASVFYTNSNLNMSYKRLPITPKSKEYNIPL